MNTKYLEFLYFRNNELIVCQTEPLVDNFYLYKPQRVVVSWIDPGIPDEDTGFSFTYRPNPVIHSVTPTVTIPR